MKPCKLEDIIQYLDANGPCLAADLSKTFGVQSINKIVKEAVNDGLVFSKTMKSGKANGRTFLYSTTAFNPASLYENEFNRKFLLAKECASPVIADEMKFFINPFQIC